MFYPLIDLTEGAPPAANVTIACPNCEKKLRIVEVTFGERFEDEFDCDGCGHQLTVQIALEVEFHISSEPKDEP